MPLGAAKAALFGAAGTSAAGMTAFGGIITQYVDSGDSKTYRCHTFRGGPAKFYVASGSADVDILCIAGGGGGGGGPPTAAY